MTTKHTPGPWVINQLSTKTGKGVAIDAERINYSLIEICEVWGTRNCDVINEEAMANASLISAAPEMYAALSACHESMAYMSEYDIPLTLPEQVKAALDKASGII